MKHPVSKVAALAVAFGFFAYGDGPGVSPTGIMNQSTRSTLPEFLKSQADRCNPPSSEKRSASEYGLPNSEEPNVIHHRRMMMGGSVGTEQSWAEQPHPACEKEEEDGD